MTFPSIINPAKVRADCSSCLFVFLMWLKSVAFGWCDPREGVGRCLPLPMTSGGAQVEGHGLLPWMCNEISGEVDEA